MTIDLSIILPVINERENLRALIPRLREIDQQRDRRVIALADALAKTLSTHAISTWLMEHEPWNLMMIGWPEC